MEALTSYRNERDYDFCPGCSHSRVLDALDRALVHLQWDPAEIVIVSDIGCVGLSDQYFVTSAFHGLHGRSLTYATGIKLARPHLKVIVLIGDGGCGIGGTHLVSAARRNIDVTTLVFNNLNFGMTGGEHSVATPLDGITSTSRWGHQERPLDIAATVALNGANYAWRGTAFDARLSQHIICALDTPGFALLDIWELCVAYYASANRLGAKDLQRVIDELGFASGVLTRQEKPGYVTRQEAISRDLRDQAAPKVVPPPEPGKAKLERQVSVILAGSAGAHIRTAAKLIGSAATRAGLWASQRDDYPVTVRSGHSISEVVIAPEEVRYTGIQHPDALFLLSPEGLAKAQPYLQALSPDGWLFVPPQLATVDTPAHRVILEPALFSEARGSVTLAQVAAGLAHMGLLPPDALLSSAQALSPKHGEQNRRAVALGLAAATALSDLPG